MSDNTNLDDNIKIYFPFKEFRTDQYETIKTILESFIDKNNDKFILEAPTGTGKSVIGYTVGKVLHDYYKKNDDKYEFKPSSPPIIICTSTKQLQQQYADTFKRFNVRSIWSSQNYNCANPQNKGDDVKYGQNNCLGTKCPFLSKCTYYIDLKKFNKADVGICNYHYFLNKKTLSSKILILDEAHNLQNILCDYSSLKLSKWFFDRITSQIKKYSVKVKLKETELFESFQKLFFIPIDKLENGVFYEYAEELLTKLKDINKKLSAEYEEIRNQFNDEEDLENNKLLHSQLKNIGIILDSLKSTINKLKNYLKSIVKWVVSELDITKYKITIKPLEISECMKLFENNGTKILFMSATICGHKQYIQELGLDGLVDTLSTKCLFPIQNRKVYNLQSAFLNYKNKKEVLPVMVKEIDKIINWMTSNWTKPIGGVIHTVSFENAHFIKQHSQYKDVLFTPDKNEMLNLNNILKERGPTILNSPSILEGVDLMDDLSRFQIFMKVPYAHLGDRWVNLKKELDPIWYSRDTIIKIVQGSGRSIRSMEDWAWTFILDSNFNILLNRNSQLFPTWFKESIIGNCQEENFK